MSDPLSGKEQVTKLTEAILSRAPASSLPAMPLTGYLSLWAEQPAPTPEQVHAFALYASRAKSWYKHISLWQPGESFHFFLDPFAGMDTIFRIEDGYSHVERTATSPSGHYSWMTTRDYIEKFGRLSFCCAAGSSLYFPIGITTTDGERGLGLLDKNVDRPTIRMAESEFRIPEEIFDSGKAVLSGVIHPDSSKASHWRTRLDATSSSFSWPKATGGQDTVNSILQICQAENNKNQDTELDEVLKPERQRQVETMVKAIERMIAVIYG